MLPLNAVIRMLSFIEYEFLFPSPLHITVLVTSLLSLFLTPRNSISQLLHSTVFILEGPFRRHSGTQSVMNEIFHIPSKTLQINTRYFFV